MEHEKTAVDSKGPAQPNRAAGEQVAQTPSPVKEFDPGKSMKDRRLFPNGDTDRSEQN